MTKPPNPMYQRPEVALHPTRDGFWIDSLRLDEIRAELEAMYRHAKIPPAPPLRSRK